MKTDQLSGILGGIVYPMFMLPAMGFLLIQVYQINARSASDHSTIVTNEKRISVVEQNVLTHLVRHNDPAKMPPVIGPPLIQFKDRREKLRVE